MPTHTSPMVGTAAAPRTTTAASCAIERLSSDQEHNCRGNTSSLDAELDTILGATSSSALVKRLRRIRAETKLTTEGSFVSDEPAYSRGSITVCRARTQLCWRNGVLTWSRGCALVRTFTFQEPILQAFWTSMEVDSPDPVDIAPGKHAASSSRGISGRNNPLRTRGAFSALQRHRLGASMSASDRRDARICHDPERPGLERALCIFFQQGILIHLPQRGEEHRIDLPFRPSRAFPMPIGLFILRQTEVEDVEIADRLQRQQRQLGRDSSMSSAGYPFPDVLAPQTPDFGPFEPPMDEDDIEEELASSVLPMAFHLRRPFDELAPVDRFPQISESLLGPESTARTHFVHGPASPFTEVDETIVFVSRCTRQSPFPVLVTASHRSRSIRIYSFSATPTRPNSTSIILSSRLSHRSKISSDGPSSQGTDGAPRFSSTHDSTFGRNGGVEEVGESSQDPQSSMLKGIGRGLPSTRKSGRIELERRSSSKSVPMGRDPSGRSRRISAMHAGNNERRMASRVEDVNTLARDRTMNGNISQTVDGLRRQSQALTQEAMMDELATGNQSVRIASSARLRRSSQAVRTPYAGPRTASRQPATAARTPAARSRLSMSMPRHDGSIDNFDLSSYPGTAPSTGKLGKIDAEALDSESGSRSADSDPFGGLADLDNFARSFAAVALLDEIRVSGLDTASDASRVTVQVARFSEATDSPVHVYTSVPSCNQTFCRQVQYRHYAAEAGHGRRVLHASRPDASLGSATLDTANVAVLRKRSGTAEGVVTVDSDGVLALSIGPIGSATGSLNLGHWSRWSSQQLHDDGQGCASPSMPASISNVAQGSELQLRFAGWPEPVPIEVDIEPACPLTGRAFQLFAAMLSPTSYAQLRGAWIMQRFGLDKHAEQREAPRPDHDWDVLARLLTGRADEKQASPTPEDPVSRLADSLSHAELGGADFFAGFKAMPRRPKLSRDDVDGPRTGGLALPVFDRRLVAVCLHLLAQDSRLDSVAAVTDLSRLAHVLVDFASSCGLESWVDYWKMTVPSASSPSCAQRGKQTSDPRAEATAPPFDIYEVLAKQIRGKVKLSVPELVRDLARTSISASTQEVILRVCGRTSQLMELYSLFAASHGTTPVDASRTQHVAHRIVESMVALGVDHERIRSFPLGLALPLFEAVRSSQLEPPLGWSAAAYELVYRTDLAMHTNAGSAGHSTDLAQTVAAKLVRTLPKRAKLDPLCAQIFSKDFRLVKVVKMLETTTPNAVHVPEVEDQPEAMTVEQHSRAVAGITERTKAVPVGRGMFFMSSKPFRVTQKWQIPHLNLSVKVVPRGTTVEPDTKMDSAPLEWPEFHNGVASILEISVGRGAAVDSKWIFSHLGEEPTAKHAGFLFGLGLTRHLPALAPVHVFRYLKARHNLLTIGFLLGMGASAVGTGDPAARHLLGMQLVAFLPPGSAPLNLSILTQTAGLLAMGLVFLGSNHRWTANRMLQQIGAAESPIPDVQSQHREAYSLSAGLALGLVMLGKGRTEGMTSLPDKRILVKLEQLINGSLADLQRSKRKPSATKIELNPDLSLTSIPASVALGLIFLRSNRADMAELLWLPKTAELLNYIRPDVLLVRVLARYLILWDDVRCSSEWVESVLPEWMRTAQDRPADRRTSEATQLAAINMRAGACFAMGLKYAGSHEPAARACLLQQLTQLNRDAKAKATTYYTKIRQSALQAAADLVMVSLAAVVAGSGDLEVLRVLRQAHGDVDGGRSYGSHMATHMALGLLFLGGGRMTLGSSDSAIAALLIAFFPRFPGSSTDNRAHLQAFRHLWVLAAEPRLLIAKDVETGEAAAVPLRLRAATGDDETKQTATIAGRRFTPILLPSLDRISSIATDTARYWPTSLQPSSSPEHAATLLHSRIMHVQRKTGYLSYTDDPQGSRSIFSRSLGTAPLDLGRNSAAGLGPSPEELRELVRGFACTGKHEELIEWLCGQAGADDVEQPGAGSVGLQALLRTVVMECLTLDKAYMVPTYLDLVLALNLQPASGPLALATLVNIRFAEEFYAECFDRLVGSSEQSRETTVRAPLIQRGLLSKLLHAAQQRARTLLSTGSGVQQAFTAFLRPSRDGSAAKSDDDVEAQTALSFLWTCEGRPQLETMRELALLVRQAAPAALQEGKTREKAIDALANVAQLAIQSLDQERKWSPWLVKRVVECAVEDATTPQQ